MSLDPKKATPKERKKVSLSLDFKKATPKERKQVSHILKTLRKEEGSKAARRTWEFFTIAARENIDLTVALVKYFLETTTKEIKRKPKKEKYSIGRQFGYWILLWTSFKYNENKDKEATLKRLDAMIKDCKKRNNSRLEGLLVAIRKNKITELFKSFIAAAEEDLDLYVSGLPIYDIVKIGKPFLDAIFVPTHKIEQQLRLFPANDKEQVTMAIEQGIEGIDLDIYEDRALDGILHRFTILDYPDQIDLTESEFYELAGAKRIQTARGKHEFPGRETEKLKNGLKRIDSKKYPIILKRRRGYDKKKKSFLYDVARVNQSLINLIWLYRGVDDKTLTEYTADLNDGKAIDDDKKIAEYFHHWRISLNPLIREDIKGKNFRLLPYNIHGKISDYKQQRGLPARVLKSERNFIRWIHKHGKNREEIRSNWLVLARALKLTKLIQSRKLKQLRERITGLYQMAQDLGYLSSFEVNKRSKYTEDKTVDVLYLNKGQFYHLGGLRDKGGLPLKRARSTTKKSKVYH